MPTSKQSSRILFVLFVGVLMGALDIAIVGPALPTLRSTFAIDDRAAAWIFTTYVLFNLMSVPLMAKLSDVFGRRSIYILDVLLFAAGSLIVAVSPTFPLLIIGRAVQGLGAGGIFPVASAVIGDTFPPEKRGSALGMIGAVFGIAFLIGPILAGIVLHYLSWQWLFVINLPIAVAVVFLAYTALPASHPLIQRRFDIIGMVILTVLLASLTYGINQIDTAHLAESLSSLSATPFILLAAILVPVLVWVESRAESPVIRTSLFSSRQVALTSVVAAGAGLGEASVVFVPALVVAAFHVPSSTASFMLLPAVLAMAVGSPSAGRLLDRVGSRTVLFIATLLVTMGMFIVAILGANVLYFYVSAILVGLGLGMLLGAPLRYVMLNESQQGERAAAQGILTLFTSTGQLAGGAFVGAVAGSFGGGLGGYSTAFLAVGAVMLLLTALTWGLKNRAAELETARQNHLAAQSQTAMSPVGTQT